MGKTRRMRDDREYENNYSPTWDPPASSEKEPASNNEPKDETKNCKDCGNPFQFTVGEQRYYRERDFKPPVRCPECRKVRKANRNATSDNR